MPNILCDPQDVTVGTAQILEAALDITSPVAVEVLVNKQRGILHVNVNGICALRIGRIPTENFEVETRDA